MCCVCVCVCVCVSVSVCVCVCVCVCCVVSCVVCYVCVLTFGGNSSDIYYICMDLTVYTEHVNVCLHI